ncbi:MAG: rhodanese-like domain-containing protein [Methylococcales bacterium]|nr:rhodanese-like domain-containing protein [Methylococcales bacterium]
MSSDVKGLSVQASWDLLQSDPRALLIDIRSGMEFLFVGHPVGAIHIPWIDEPDWDINPNFVADVRKVLLGGGSSSESAAPVILICRSGKRSLAAGLKLIEANVGDVYHIEEGFEGELNEAHQRSAVGGWRFHNMPWEQC